MENNELHDLIMQTNQPSDDDSEQSKGLSASLDDTLFIYFSDKSALDVLKVPYKIISSLIDLREYLMDERVCNILIIPDDDVLKTLINVSRYEKIIIVRGVGILDAPKEGLVTPTGGTIDVIDDKKFFELYRQSADSFENDNTRYDSDSSFSKQDERDDDDSDDDDITNS